MILELMRRSISYANTKNCLEIKSAFAPKGSKGFIYVEAYLLRDVQKVSLYFPSLRKGVGEEKLVPMNNMRDVLRRKTETKNRKYWCDRDHVQKKSKKRAKNTKPGEMDLKTVVFCHKSLLISGFQQNVKNIRLWEVNYSDQMTAFAWDETFTDRTVFKRSNSVSSSHFF